MNRNIRPLFIVFFTLILSCTCTYSQVLERDSLALVALYDSTTGVNWISNTNWKEGPVNTWFGIITVNDRVTEVRLSSNNLAGPIPPSLGDLDALEELRLDFNSLTGGIPVELGNLSSLTLLNLIDNNLQGRFPLALEELSRINIIAVSGNQLEGEIPSNLFSDPPNIGGNRALFISNNFFTDLPDYTDIELFSIFAEGNLLTFEDVEPNLSLNDQVPRFTYSPQRPVYDSLDVAVAANSGIILKAEVGGSANQYQWYKDGEVLPGATNPTLALNDINVSDAGSYTAMISSSVVTDLTIERLPVRLTVFDRRPTAFCSQTTLDAMIEDTTATYSWSTGAVTPSIEVTELGIYSVTIETANYIAEEPYITELAPADIVPGVDVTFETQVNGQGLIQDQALLVDGPVQFLNTSQAGNDFHWDFGDGVSSEEGNPTHTFQLPGRYVVRLNAQDDKGCNVVLEREVQVQELFVANAITPNGDGDNDQWYVEPFLYPASLRVINRWGQEVYYTGDYQNDFNGNGLQAGVYFYELVIENVDQTLTGNVSIIK